MSGALIITASLLMSTPVVNVCAIRDGEVSSETPVFVQGRWLTDHMHISGLATDDMSCFIEWRWAPGVFDSPAAEELSRNSDPMVEGGLLDTFEAKVSISAAGEVRSGDDGRRYFWVTELRSVTVHEAGQ
jgi:hypothetical protein